MIILEKIKEIESRIVEYTAIKDSLASRVRIEIANKIYKKELCGKCEEGYIRIPYPNISGADLPDFLARGYLSLCDCIGVSGLEEKRVDADDKLERLEGEARGLRSRRSWLAAKIGEDYVDKGLHNYNRQGNEESIDSLIAWSKSGRKSPLMIIGKTGTGKTHILAGILNQFILDRVDFLYIDGYKIDDLTLKEKYDRDRAVDDMSRVPVLIIDDIGKSKMSDALLSHVYFPILQSRRNNRLITIYTSDKVPRKLWSTFPDRENIEALYTRIEWIEDGSPKLNIVVLKEGGK
jgi:DNA replication protein DnaC